MIRYILLAVGLLYFGKQKRMEEIEEAMNTLPATVKLFATILLDVCAYAGILLYYTHVTNNI